MAATIQIERRGASNKTGIGARIKTKEDFRHIRGAGNFVDDMRLPRMAFASILRSPYAHARIKKIDYSRAYNSPGVIGILTSEDVVKMSDPLPQMTVAPVCKLEGLSHSGRKSKVRWRTRSRRYR